MRIETEFVDAIPAVIEEGKLYVSLKYGTAVHKCCCGCGREVVTPLSPTDWKVTFDGEAVSLYPSIGNWSFPCRSHYWIDDGQVFWAEKWTEEKVRAGKARDFQTKRRYYESVGKAENKPVGQSKPQQNESESFAAKLRRLLGL